MGTASGGGASSAASGVATIPAERAVTVGRGDSVYLIAKRYAVPMRELIDLNQLKAPYRLEIGQRLVLPTTRTYTVQSGDAFSKLAQRFQVAPAELARLNHLEPPYGLRIGQVLVLPGESGAQLAATPVPVRKPEPGDLNPVHGTASPAIQTAPLAPPKPAAPAQPHPMSTAQSQGARSLAAMPTARRPEPGAAEPPAAAPPAAAPATVTAPAPASAPAPAKAAAPVAAASGGKLLWPVQGKVISGYGDLPDGRHNDGVNIAAAKGAPVIAADNGVVAYVGNELRGYGNLLLIRHSGGLMTAYAHLDHATVERGAAVRRGQKVGSVGATGTVTSPQLHFEVRRGSQPVDPGEFMDVPRAAPEPGAGGNG